MSPVLFIFIACAIFLSNIERNFAKMSGDTVKTATFKDVQALGNNSSVLLIDVREPAELKETGVIPGSINIPLGKVKDVFENVSDDDFKVMYGRSKPKCDTPIVLSCKSGRRSMTALETIAKLGYSDLTNYSGGWLDWEEHIKKQ